MSATLQSIQEYLRYLALIKRASPHTVKSYELDLEQFAAYLEQHFESMPLAEVEAPMVRSWMVAMKQENIAAASIKRKLSALKSFYKYRMKQGMQEHTPMQSITAPKLPQRLPVYVEKEQMERLFQLVSFTDDWEGQTDYLVLQLLYQTGMRRAELAALQRNSVDFSRNMLRVLGKGNKERFIPLLPVLAKKLQEYLHNPACPLVHPSNTTALLLNKTGKPITADNIYTIVTHYLSMVTTIPKKSPHVLRHSFATHLSNNGADLNAIKELMGHSSLASTQIYTHNTIEQLKEIHKKAHPKGE